MYINREIDHILLDWKNADRHKPLILRGVRQCGKTSAVRNLSQQFADYIELNLEKEPDIGKIFEGELNINRIINRLELHFSKRISSDTLLFIDEIQECPRAVTALRYFYEDKPELHVIAAGSLLEFVLDGQKKDKPVDFPVGRVRSIFMYPFSFTEFLHGTGKEILADYLKHTDFSETPNDAHKELLEEYKTFLIVGGMPEAVREYAETGSIQACQQIHRDIILNFKDDFNKYSRNVSPEIIRKVFDYATHHVCSQTKSSSAVTGISAYYFDLCIDLLKKAGLVRVEAGVGGASLAKPPEEITLLDIFRAVEPKEEPLFHFHENPNPACPVGREVHGILSGYLDAAALAMENQLRAVRQNRFALCLCAVRRAEPARPQSPAAELYFLLWC